MRVAIKSHGYAGVPQKMRKMLKEVSGERGALEAGWRTCAECRASEYLEALRTSAGA